MSSIVRESKALAPLLENGDRLEVSLVVKTFVAIVGQDTRFDLAVELLSDTPPQTALDKVGIYL